MVTMESTTKLKFEQSLIAKDKTIPAGDLLKRLKNLNEKLKELRQEEVDSSSCDQVALELVTPTLIQHRDGGVRALLACCLAEILRIYAPNAPYNTDHLKNIFSLFVREIRGLSHIDDTYYLFHVQLFSSLALVRSISLVTELDNADDMLMEFFHTIMTHINSKHPPVLKQYAVDIMSTLIDESASLPVELTELLLKHMGDEPSRTSHALAVKVGQTCVDQLQKYACQYFVELLLDAAKAKHQQRPSTDQFLALKNAHLLFTKVYQHVPQLLLNIIPQLEEELVTENSQFRLLSIQTIGTCLSQRHPFIKQYPQAWKSWLNRRNDKLPELRLLWLSFVPSIYNMHSTFVSMDLNPCLEQKLLDIDDQVRYAACECINRIQFSVLKSCMTRSFLNTLGSRIKDKSFKVRLQAMETTSHLWKQLMCIILPVSGVNGHQEGKERCDTLLEEEEINEWMALFGGLPASILSSAYLNANDLTAVLENMLIDHVLQPKEVRTDDWKLQAARFLWFLSCICEDARALQALYSVFQRQAITMQELRLFSQLTREKDTLISDAEKTAWSQRMRSLVQAMVSRLPDSQGTAHATLMKVSELPSEQWVPQFEILMNWSESEFKAIRKAGKRLLEYFEREIPGSRQVLGVLARRVSPALVCKERIPYFIEVLQTASMGYRTALREGSFWLMKSVIKLFPEIFASEIPVLTDLAQNYPDLGLPLLSRLPDQKYSPGFVKDLHQRLRDPAQTLYVAKILARSKPAIYKETFSEMFACMEKDEDRALMLVALQVFAQLAKYQKEFFLEKAVKVVPSLFQLFNPKSFSYRSKCTDNWIKPDAWSIETNLQVVGLRILSYHAMGSGFEPVMHLLSQILKRKGTLLSEWPEFAGSALRLHAAKALLRIASSGFDHRIPTGHSLLLLNVVQDPVSEVREGVLMKIKTGLQKKTLSFRYLSFFCYSALQPNVLLKNSLIAYLKSQDVIMELPRLVFVCAHRGTVDEWTQLIQTVLHATLDAHQVGVAYHLTTLLKTHRVASQAPRINEQVYLFADVMLKLIREQCKLHNWPLTNCVDAQLPAELFIPLPADEAMLNATRNYLPEAPSKKRELPATTETPISKVRHMSLDVTFTPTHDSSP